MKDKFLICRLFMMAMLIVCCSCGAKGPVYSSLFLVEANGKLGFIDSTGTIIIEPQYVDLDIFCDGLAIAVVDTTITKGIVPNFDDCYTAQDSAALQNWAKDIHRVALTYGYIDKSNNFVIKPSLRYEFNYINTSIFEEFKKLQLSNGRIMFCDNTSGKYGYLDNTGQIIISAQYRDANRFSDSLAHVQDDQSGDWGYIDDQGNVVIDFQYHKSTDFSEGLAAVNQVVAYLDEESEDGIFTYKEGAVKFRAEGKLIDKKGEVVLGKWAATQMHA